MDFLSFDSLVILEVLGLGGGMHSPSALVIILYCIGSSHHQCLQALREHTYNVP